MVVLGSILSALLREHKNGKLLKGTPRTEQSLESTCLPGGSTTYCYQVTEMSALTRSYDSFFKKDILDIQTP
jgi:hypothetical protein